LQPEMFCLCTVFFSKSTSFLGIFCLAGQTKCLFGGWLHLAILFARCGAHCLIYELEANSTNFPLNGAVGVLPPGSVCYERWHPSGVRRLSVSHSSFIR
jgi:hypothetical protein